MNYSFIKKNIPLKNGEFPVYIRIFDNKTSRYISLKFSVKAKNWNDKKQIIKATDKEYIVKNRKIQAYKNVCEKIILDSILNQENLSLDLFKKRILNNDNTLFFDYAKNVIEKKTIKTSTKKEYLGRLDWIYNFINSQAKIVDFSESFLNDLKYKLIHDGNSLTTVSNIFAVISIVLNVAVKDEIIKYNYCKNITISKDTKEKEALSLDELKLIENLIPGLKSKSKIAAKLFLISAKTGLSKTDIDHFKMSDIKTIVLKGKNYYLLKGHREKDSVKFRVPVSIETFELIQSLDNGKTYPLKRFSNSAIQQHIKGFRKLLPEIKTKFTFHTARHTFATYYSNLNLSEKILMPMMGHTRTSTNRIYSHVSDTAIIEAVAKYDELANL